MPHTSLLLLAIVLLASNAIAVAQSKSSEPAPMIATAGDIAPLGNSAAVHAFRFIPPESSVYGAPSGDICYKIRAYIFKRDDDHAPEFVRSTTCGPRIPHEKNAAWPKAKLVPAN